MMEYHFGFVSYGCRLIRGAVVFLAPRCRYCADYRRVALQHDAMNMAHLAHGAIAIKRYAAAAAVQIIRSPHFAGVQLRHWVECRCQPVSIGRVGSVAHSLIEAS
jgi:hypothetical protein